MTTALPSLLYKYVPADAGLSMLKSASLRWSSPDLWLGAYEMNGRVGLPFTQTEFLDSTVRLATSLIFKPSAPQGDSPLISAINRWREAERFQTPEEARVVLHDLLKKMVAQRQEVLEESVSQWKNFTQATRAICLSADRDALMLWNSYANHHQGTILALDPQADELLSEAKPVIYDTGRTHITTLKEQVGSLLHNSPNAMHTRFESNLLHKPAQLKHEQEWRAWVTTRSAAGSNSLHEDKPLSAGSIKGIYLGSHIPKETAASICAAAQAINPKPKIFKTRFVRDEFKLEAVPL